MFKMPVVVKEENKVESADAMVGRDQEIRKFGSQTPILDLGTSKPSSPKQDSDAIIESKRLNMDMASSPSSSNPKDLSTLPELAAARAKMGEVKEENERLKAVLARIVKDYQSLQMHFFDIVRQEQAKNTSENSSKHHDIEDPELVSLSLGTSPSRQCKKEEKAPTKKKKKEEQASKSEVDYQMQEGLTLGLDSKFEGSSNANNVESLSPDNGSDDPKEEEASGVPWPPTKIPKNLREGDDGIQPQAQVKRARVSVRARCDTPTMNDGCQWRKYGQKVSKGNPCPRAYYRCTVAPSCPVRKQVQRCAEDMSILITTYEGTHNHPLPVSATAMASTTSAAATMLTSGASKSSLASSSTATADLHGLNFALPADTSRSRQFNYLSNTSPFPPSTSHTTITLDLTTTQSSQLNRFPSNFTATPVRYPPTSFNFADSTMPASWSTGYLPYGAQSLNYKSHINTLSQLPYWQKATNSALQLPAQAQQAPLTDTIAKAITSDPSFQSALAAAITSYVGGQGAPDRGASGCTSSYLNRSNSLGSSRQEGSQLTLLQTPVGSASAKSSSASPVDDREDVD